MKESVVVSVVVERRDAVRLSVGGIFGASAKCLFGSVHLANSVH